MTTVKVEMLWSPRLADRFITYGTDLRLYQFDSKVYQEDTHNVNIDKTSELLSFNPDIQYLRCASWSPREDYDTLFAVGQQNGKVLITSFDSHQDHSGLLGKEFAPRYLRQINCLAWNPTEKNLLAVGLEKTRSDCSLLVWDVQKAAANPGDLDKRSLGNAYDGSVIQPRPIAEIGLNETTHSFHWLTKEPKTIIAGMNHKYLRICDMRDSSRQPTTASTKAVHGVCADLFHTNWIASYYENQTMIWDIRNFDKPMIVLTDTQPISRIAWCPTRANFIATIAKDSLVIKLYDIQQTGIGSDEFEPTIVERNLQVVSGGLSLSTFTWHPSIENCITTINSAGQFHSQVIGERITLNWSPTSRLVWSHGKKILQYIDQNDEVYDSFDDISVKMRQRAIAGYGLEMQHLWKNGEIVKSDQQLKNLWVWLDLVKSLREESKSRTGSTAFKLFTSQTGVHSLIRSDGGGGSMIRSEVSLQSWEGVQLNKLATKIYRSYDRERSLQLCNWNFNKEGTNVGSQLDGLEADEYFQRAAAIAVFNSKIIKATQILRQGSQKSGDSSLCVVAMALSGYTTEKNSLWREMCEKLRSQLVDPYLRAMFAFLTSDNDSYDDVLNETGVTIQDRVAFACIFLPDNKLVDFLDKTMKGMIETGTLDGLLLTGLSKDGLDLLQRYVDMTGDIQTASLVVVQSLPSDAGSEFRALQWIESYRDLLDQWRLWQQRAQFDVNWHKSDIDWRASRQVFISCNFCGKSICALMQDKGRNRNNYSGTSPNNKMKFTCCPSCRKPLPRCSLCLIHMGTPSNTPLTPSTEEKIGRFKVTDEQKLHKLCLFMGWFTWCQSCRHGGHANHIAAWFKEHSECPVTACNCKCMALDEITSSENPCK